MDLTLSPLDSGNHPTVRIPYEDLEYEKGAEDYPAEIGEREGSDVETEEWNDEVEIREQHYKEFVIGAKQAEPEDFEPPFGVSRVNLREEFGTSGVQVIVKLASIFLTPEKPDYPGGSWHIEGKEVSLICLLIWLRVTDVADPIERAYLCQCHLLLRK